MDNEDFENKLISKKLEITECLRNADAYAIVTLKHHEATTEVNTHYSVRNMVDIVEITKGVSRIRKNMFNEL